MNATAALTAEEVVFAQRMLPHFLSGLSPVDAAKAVIADDARLASAFFDRQHSHFVPTADERGASYQTRVSTGDVMAAEITREVYTCLRA